MFSTIKASSGVMIVAYFSIFIGVVCGTILELFLVEASRTNKTRQLLRSEANVWIAFAALTGGVGLFMFFYIWIHISAYFASDPEGRRLRHFGCPHREGKRSVRLVSTDDPFVLERADSHSMLKEMDLPLSVEQYERILWEYLHFFDAFSLTRAEEMKAIFLRSAVWFKKPLQFGCVILVQLLPLRLHWAVHLGPWQYWCGARLRLVYRVSRGGRCEQDDPVLEVYLDHSSAPLRRYTSLRWHLSRVLGQSVCFKRL